MQAGSAAVRAGVGVGAAANAVVVPQDPTPAVTLVQRAQHVKQTLDALRMLVLQSWSDQKPY